MDREPLKEAYLNMYVRTGIKQCLQDGKRNPFKVFELLIDRLDHAAEAWRNLNKTALELPPEEQQRIVITYDEPRTSRILIRGPASWIDVGVEAGDLKPADEYEETPAPPLVYLDRVL
jgi:hypothetical protein